MMRHYPRSMRIHILLAAALSTAVSASAADAVKAFHPKVVYPYHYQGSDLKAFESALAGSGVEVRIRNWY